MYSVALQPVPSLFSNTYPSYNYAYVIFLPVVVHSFIPMMVMLTWLWCVEGNATEATEGYKKILATDGKINMTEREKRRVRGRERRMTKWRGELYNFFVFYLLTSIINQQQRQRYQYWGEREEGAGAGLSGLRSKNWCDVLATQIVMHIFFCLVCGYLFTPESNALSLPNYQWQLSQKADGHAGVKWWFLPKKMLLRCSYLLSLFRGSSLAQIYFLCAL